MPKYAVSFAMVNVIDLSTEIVQADSWQRAVRMHSKIDEAMAAELSECVDLQEGKLFANNMDCSLAITVVSEDCNVSIWSSLEMECVVRGMPWPEYMTFHCKGAKLSEAGYTALNALFNLEFEKEVANG